MAKTKRKAGKRATAAGRDGPRARKCVMPKTGRPGSRKPKPTKPAPHKRKSSSPSETARLKRRLKTARMQQQASAEILRAVLNASGDAALPLQQIAEITARLFGAPSVSIQLAEGGEFTQEYRVGAIAQRIGSAYPRSNIRVGGPNMPGTVVFENRQIHIPDLDHLDPSMSHWPGLPYARAGGSRTLCGTPLRREGTAIGALMIFRDRLLPFTDDELALQQSFADQAVIAIENARLFNETKAALERQTATSEVLKVISDSPGELKPVFNAMLENAVRICEAKFGNLFLVDGDSCCWTAGVNTPEKLAQYFTESTSFRPTPGSHLDRVIRTREVSHTADDMAEAVVGAAARFGGARSTVCVPMVKDDALVGAIFIYRTEVRPFTGKQIDLVKSFAAQAVIAIENARLFDEVQAKTGDLTESLKFQMATSDVLKVISRSPDALQPVLDVIVETSRVLCNALTSVIFLLREDKFHDVAESSEKPDYIEALRANPIPLNKAGSVLARAAREKRTIHVANTAEDPEFGLGGPLDQGGARSLLSVPLIQDGGVIGGITLRQSYLTPFTPRQIEAVETFADQAVIAISNVNLFEQVQQRTRELAASLDDLRTAQDRLVQTEKLASLGQLTAGIAHEIKNPLNFVNNFSALSAELVDELNDTLKPAALEPKTRQEVDDLTQMLKGNLEKVVQHGKRADSIVKNMLLHSRDGSGEHRPTDINALLDESLNLAYHGARAEKSEFNITLQRDFDEQAGIVEVFPQEITRAFLNLISNGFYAATKRKGENGGPDFEPVLSAVTKNLGNHVEIRIRDNGTGIPPEVKDKIFNPFFTTKPAGEGTGLGLSMSHDIVVKQHGGTIEVDTQPRQFTEFTIVLPRRAIIRK